VKHLLLALLILNAQVTCFGQRIVGVSHRAAKAITGTPPTFTTNCEFTQAAGGGILISECTLTGGTAGGTIAVGVWVSTSGTTLSSVTDNCGDTFTLYDNPTATNSGGAATAVARAYNVTGGTCLVTSHWSSSNGNKYIYAESIAGTLASGDPLDQHTVAATTTSSTTCTDCLSSGNVTTTQNNEYVFGIAMCGTGVGVLRGGSGFTESISVPPTLHGMPERLAKISAGVTAALFTRSGTTSATVNVHIMTFKSATPS
jgi:hypothetical protein